MTRRRRRTLLVLALVAAAAVAAPFVWSRMARVPEPPYTVDTREDSFEVRTYPPRVVAETVVEGGRDASANEGFRRLAGYIFGGNSGREKLAMTAPVGQRAEGRRLAMTAPVGQRREGASWVVTFTMPAGETLASLPRPLDARVVLRETPPERVAVVRYSGRWTESSVAEKTEALRTWAREKGLEVAGDPEVNRYDPPWTLWFLRRNEVWLPLAPAPS